MHMLHAKIWSLDEEKAKNAQPKEVRLFIQLFLHEKTDNGDSAGWGSQAEEEAQRAAK